MVHRLTVLYLMLPVTIWLVGWFHWWLGIPAALLIAIALGRPILPSWNVSSWKISFTPATGVLLLIALAWVMATAAGGVFDIDNHDWVKHRALLLHLSRDEWPVYFTTYVDLPLLLRYYLGYYMVPGMLGKWFGVVALNWAVPLWTWCGAALALLLFTRAYQGWWVLAAAPILVFFGMTTGLIPLWENPYDYSLLRRFAYTPQHIIAAVLFTLLIIQLRRHTQFLPISGVVIAASLFWSTFIAIALLPLVGVLVFQNGVRSFLHWQNVLVAPPSALLFAVYMSSGFVQIPRRWIWEINDTLYVTSVISYVSTLLLLALLVVILRPHIRHDPMFLVYPTILPVTLLISFGHLNDWARYMLATAIVVLCYYGTKTVIHGWGEFHEWYRRTALAVLILAAAVGLVSPTLRHSLPAVESHDFRVFRYERIENHATLFSAVEPIYSDQYVAPGSAWHQLLLKNQHAEASRGQGQLIIESDYSVYLKGKLLVYVRPKCSREDLDSRFILHITPVDKTILDGREHDNRDFNFTWNGMRVVDTCLVLRDLPAYAIASFTTGQYLGGANPTGHKWIATYHMPME